jgi:hypothetical protein
MDNREINDKLLGLTFFHFLMLSPLLHSQLFLFLLVCLVNDNFVFPVNNTKVNTASLLRACACTILQHDPPSLILWHDPPSLSIWLGASWLLGQAQWSVNENRKLNLKFSLRTVIFSSTSWRL